LTANGGPDDQVSFLPDGSAFIYHLRGWGGANGCLGLMPVGRSRVSRVLCPQGPDAPGTAYSRPAVSPTGRLAFILSRQTPSYNALVTAPLADPRDTVPATLIPFTTLADHVTHFDVQDLAWLRGDTLAVLADGTVYLAAPGQLARDWMPVPLPGSAGGIGSNPDGSVLYAQIGRTVAAWNPGSGMLPDVFTFDAVPIGLVQVGRHDLVAMTPGGLIRVDRSDGSISPIGTYGLVILETALAWDGSDLIVSAQDTAGPITTDLYRLRW
ncbi:MAG: hypothetical protein AB7I33_13715, partial [Gemmatimonadales bacterium]